MTVNKAVALRLSELLEKNKMTQYKLAKKMGTNHSTISNIISERNSDNKLSTLIIISEVLGITVSQFLDSSLFDINNLDI